jgi:hypothetical protein
MPSVIELPPSQDTSTASDFSDRTVTAIPTDTILVMALA